MSSKIAWKPLVSEPVGSTFRVIPSNNFETLIDSYSVCVGFIITSFPIHKFAWHSARHVRGDFHLTDDRRIAMHPIRATWGDNNFEVLFF